MSGRRVDVRELGRFMTLGLVVIGLGLGANAVGIELLHLPPSGSYAISLAIQLLAGFALNRWVVFRGQRRPLGSTLLGYGAANVAFRLADWAAFIALTSGLGMYWLTAHVINASLFFILKYVGYRVVFLAATRTAGTHE